jgi:hypothetical protein
MGLKKLWEGNEYTGRPTYTTVSPVSIGAEQKHTLQSVNLPTYIRATRAKYVSLDVFNCIQTINRHTYLQSAAGNSRMTKQDRQCTYTFVQPLLQWKSNKCYIFWVCVYGLRYPARKAHASYRHRWHVRLYNILPQKIFGNKRVTEQKMCALILSITVPGTFLILDHACI